MPDHAEVLRAYQDVVEDSLARMGRRRPWEVSLFTGAGGGLLATRGFFRPVAYVEWDGWCQDLLRRRIEDGQLEAAPIFGDINDFIGGGFAAELRRVADGVVVTGGFPCQPFSVAGVRRGRDDARNQWPATEEVVRIIRPRLVLLENVPGLLGKGARGYFGEVVGSLAEMGYRVLWGRYGANEVGAPHRRWRLWIRAERHDVPDA